MTNNQILALLTICSMSTAVVAPLAEPISVNATQTDEKKESSIETASSDDEISASDLLMEQSTIQIGDSTDGMNQQSSTAASDNLNEKEENTNTEIQVQAKTMSADDMVIELVQSCKKSEILDNKTNYKLQHIEEAKLTAGDIMIDNDVVYGFVSPGHWISFSNYTSPDINAKVNYNTNASFYRYVKQNPTYESPKNLKATYKDHYEDVDLPNGFAWTSNGSFTTIGKTTINAQFTPVNTLMYKTVTNIPLSVVVEKKVITKLDIPKLDPITYSMYGSLSKVSLPDGWTWVDPKVIPTCEVKSYEAIYNPGDADCLDLSKVDTKKMIPLSVKQGVLAVPQQLTLTSSVGKTLADIPLPVYDKGSYEWVEPKETKLTESGTFTYHLRFIPNSDNYQIIENVDATIIVTKAEPDYTIPEGLKITYGQTLSSVILPNGWKWVTPTESVGAVGVKEFPATYTDKDGLTATVNVPVEVIKAPAAQVIAPSSISLTWEDGLTLKNISLPSNWSFSDENQELLVGEHQYKIKYTPTDGESYDYSTQSLEVNLIISLSKATPEFVYPGSINLTAGKNLSDSQLPKSDFGKYTWTSDKSVVKSGTYYCKFTPNDTDHYKIVKDIAVSVSVVKTGSSNSSTKNSAENSTAETSSNSNINISTSSAKSKKSSKNAKNKGTVTTKSSTEPQIMNPPTTEAATTEAAKDKTQSDITVETGNGTLAQGEVKTRPTEVTVTQEDNSHPYDETTITTEDGSSTEQISTEDTVKQDQKPKSKAPLVVGLLALLGGGGFLGYKTVLNKKKDDEGI